MVEPTIVLGYWKIRGLVEVEKSLLELLGLKYTMEYYEVGEAPDFSRESWMSVKESKPLAFPNLPYMYDGDVKISQSTAIARYIANKYGPHLLGETPEEKAQVDMCWYEILDIKIPLTMTCYGQDFEAKKQSAIAQTQSQLERVIKYLGQKEYLCGKLSIADLALVEFSDYFEALTGSLPEQLVAHRERVLKIENLANYRKSDRFFARPFNNKRAQWK